MASGISVRFNDEQSASIARIAGEMGVSQGRAIKTAIVLLDAARKDQAGGGTQGGTVGEAAATLARFHANIEADRPEWKDDPVVVFDRKASLSIAQWVLVLFGVVYVLGFVGIFLLFWKTDATFDKGAELVKFMIQSILPLVTLAVGYYLGDRGRPGTGPAPGR